MLVGMLLGCGSSPAPSGDPNSRRARQPAAEQVAGQAGEGAADAAEALGNGEAAEPPVYSYNPVGKRDPFRSFFWEQDVGLEQQNPIGPLENFELEQLSLVAVVWGTGRPRALIADPSGRSYIVEEGTRVGKNEGRVVHIGDNLLLVKEIYEDFEGERTTKDVELKIRGIQGG
jgi:type IV pilus assembly protein PilP